MKSYSKSVKWTILEKIVVYIFQFLALAILARYLTPGDFSQIAMVMIVVAIGQTLVDSGLSASLIRKGNAKDIDFSTVHWFSIIVGSAFWCVIYILSELIQSFYDSPGLSLVVTLVSFSFVIDSFSVSVKSKLMKEFRTKEIFNATMFSSLLASIVAIILAIYGVGVYSLVFQILVQKFAFSLSVSRHTNFGKKFSISLLIEHLHFSYKLLISGLISVIYKNSYYMIIGRLYDDYIVGYFFQAKKISDIIPNIITDIVSRSTLPMLAESNNNSTKDLYENFNKAFSIVSWLSSLVILFLIFFVDDMVLILLGEQWQSSIDYVYYLIIGVAFNPLNIIALNFLQSIGRSDVFLKLEIVKKINFTIMLFFAVKYGVIGLCIGSVYVSISGLIINLFCISQSSKLKFRKLFETVVFNFAIPSVFLLLYHKIEPSYLEKIGMFLISCGAVTFIFAKKSEKSFAVIIKYIMRK